MNRREFLTSLSGAAATIPITAYAQQSTAPAHRIGLLAQDLQPGLLETFRDELQKLGYFDGSNIRIELRNAAGRNELLPTLIGELLRLKVEVIVAVNTPAGSQEGDSNWIRSNPGLSPVCLGQAETSQA
jgi:hypothetical protein